MQLGMALGAAADSGVSTYQKLEAEKRAKKSAARDDWRFSREQKDANSADTLDNNDKLIMKQFGFDDPAAAAPSPTTPTPAPGMQLATAPTPAPTPALQPAPSPLAAAPKPATPGNLDPYNRPILKNPDGSYSTTSSISIGTDAGEVVIPTVVDGKRLTEAEAIAHYKATGQHFGIFPKGAYDDADKYATALHNDQDAHVQANGGPDKFVPAGAKPATPQSPAEIVSAIKGGTFDNMSMPPDLLGAMAANRIHNGNAAQKAEGIAMMQQYYTAKGDSLKSRLQMEAMRGNWDGIASMAKGVDDKSDLTITPTADGKVTVTYGKGQPMVFDGGKDGAMQFATLVGDNITKDPKAFVDHYNQFATLEDKRKTTASEIAARQAHTEYEKGVLKNQTELVPSEKALRGAQTAQAYAGAKKDIAEAGKANRIDPAEQAEQVKLAISASDKLHKAYADADPDGTDPAKGNAAVALRLKMLSPPERMALAAQVAANQGPAAPTPPAGPSDAGGGRAGMPLLGPAPRAPAAPMAPMSGRGQVQADQMAAAQEAQHRGMVLELARRKAALPTITGRGRVQAQQMIADLEAKLK